VLRDEATLEANKAAYVRIDGFTIRHVANFSRMAAIQVRGRCHHITIENCDVQWANYAAWLSMGTTTSSATAFPATTARRASAACRPTC
jgi:hypothetical protein